MKKLIIDQFISNDVSHWHKESVYRIKNEGSIRESQIIAFEILRVLREKKLSQNDLAEATKIPEQKISKLLTGSTRFSKKNIELIQKILEIELKICYV